MSDETQGTSGDSNLDAAWRLLTLRMKERNDPDFDYDDYLMDNYDVEFDSLYKFFEAMQGEGFREDELCGLFIISFEFGKLHERYMKDMEMLS